MSRLTSLLSAALAAAVLVLTSSSHGLAAAADAQRHCLRLLVAKDHDQAQELDRRLKAGDHFAYLVRQMGTEVQTGAQRRCLGLAELNQEVQAAVGEIKPGQVTGPVALGGKWVLIQRTTDEHWLRGEEMYKAGRHQEAQEALQKDAAINPDGPAWQLLARSRAAAKDQEGALKALDLALFWKPDEVTLINDKASILLGLGRRDEALEQFEKALTLQPNNPVLQNNLAWTLVRQNQKLERAESLALRATQLEPGRASYWDTLGLTQQARGHRAGAAVSYYQALKLDPELAPAKANLLKCLLALDKATLSRLLANEPPPTAKASQAASTSRRK